MPSFVFAVLYFTEFDGHFPCMNLAKIRDAVPLNTFLLNIVGKRSMIEPKCTLYFTVLCFYMLSETKSGKCLDGTVFSG